MGCTLLSYLEKSLLNIRQRANLRVLRIWPRGIFFCLYSAIINRGCQENVPTIALLYNSACGGKPYFCTTQRLAGRSFSNNERTLSFAAYKENFLGLFRLSFYILG